MKHDKEKNKASKIPKDERRAAEARTCSENMRQLTIGFRSLVEDGLRAEGLTLPQLRMLKAVKHQTDVSAAALARTCMVTPQTMQAVLERAVQAKWIVRGKSKKNERFVTATLTPLGESELQQGMAMVVRIEGTIWEDVGLSELKQMNETLRAGIAKIEAASAAASEA
jgi:DNA-binding MarR family transcriptional regulator